MEYIFYQIKCLDPSITECYIGSSVNFTRRKCYHKSTCNNNNSPRHNLRLYSFIRDNGNWTNWEMVPIEKQTFASKIDARIYEQKLINEYKSRLNVATASVSREMYELGLQARNR